MFSVTVCCLAVAGTQFPPPEYDGPAYADYGERAESVLGALKGEALAWCVRAGMGPDWVSWLFGSPLLQSQFNGDPVTWWYPELGVSVHFPPKLFRPASGRHMIYDRAHGGIGP
jgi:hypothetical protein